jgi:muconolactone delta-isomerase
MNRNTLQHIVAALVIGATALAQDTPHTTAPAPTLANCPIFPTDHIWNTRIDDLPAHPNSDDFIATIGSEENLHPDFGSGLWEGNPIGIPITIVEPTQAKSEIEFRWENESDPGPYPIPPEPAIEGGNDRHVILLETTSCILYELYDVTKKNDGSWHAGSGAIFDLTNYQLRPPGWTSADAAGLPILPGLVRYDEVMTGSIDHALRFTAPVTRRAYVWPARHYASDREDPAYPPLGQRFRLRADYDTSEFSYEAKVIAQALKHYGMTLADNGSPWFLSGAPDERWNNDNLRDLTRIHGKDFTAIDVTPLLIHPDSGQARP